jgi:hypothetical protein
MKQTLQQYAVVVILSALHAIFKLAVALSFIYKKLA